MCKEVMSYLNGMLSMSYYIGDKSLPYSVAFIFICFICCLIGFLQWSFLFVTCPVWIGPYLIFRNIRDKKGEKNDN